MRNELTLVLLALLSLSRLSAQSGCPNCVIELPPLPVDTIYLSPAPDGETGVFYEADISFRMPRTTTPVNDPGTPTGLSINKITIINMVGLPPGLQWEANKMTFKPSEETDGCARFCGTPLQPGFYEVQVFVTAEVLLVTQSTSFSFPMYIAPATNINAGFSMLNSSGCGEVTVSFQNNLPSQGQPGFSYLWDFGNGFLSTAEQPGSVSYTVPGLYPVHYQGTVDTSGYTLTTVHILDVGCGDVSLPPIFNGAPDLYIKIKDNTGDIIYQTNAVTNAPVPFAFTLQLPLSEGNYELEVRDDDTFGSESCGTVNFNRNTTGPISSGDLTTAFDVIHPVTAVETTDTVRVFERPQAPVLDPAPDTKVCAGATALIAADYLDNLQWYRDSTLLLGETFPELFTGIPGSYWVEYTSPDGCKTASEPTELNAWPLPPPPAFHNHQNLLSLNDPNLLPSEFSLQWFLNGDTIPGADETDLCMTEPGTALYTLLVTDLTTGCTKEFSLGATYSPEFDCTVSAAGQVALAESVQVFPNPSNGTFTLSFVSPSAMPSRVQLFDVAGRLVYTRQLPGQAGLTTVQFDLSDQPTGWYFVVVRIGDQTVVRAVVRV